MLKEFGTSLKAALSDRVSSPLYGVFALSWLAWNWRLLAILLLNPDSVTVDARLESINKLGLDGNWWALLVWPLVSTAIFLLGAPWPALKAYQYSAWMKDKTIKIRDGYESHRRVTVEESLGLREEIEELKVTVLAEKKTADALNQEVSILQPRALAAEEEATRLQGFEEHLDRLVELLCGKPSPGVEGASALAFSTVLRGAIRDLLTQWSKQPTREIFSADLSTPPGSRAMISPTGRLSFTIAATKSAEVLKECYLGSVAPDGKIEVVGSITRRPGQDLRVLLRQVVESVHVLGSRFPSD